MSSLVDNDLPRTHNANQCGFFNVFNVKSSLVSRIFVSQLNIEIKNISSTRISKHHG